MFIIETLSPSEWRCWKEIRLKALLEEPLAYVSRYEKEAQWTEENWKEFLTHHTGFVAKLNDKIIGCIGIYFFDDDEDQQLGKFVAFYVDSAYRNQGVGTLLLNAVTAYANTRGAYGVTCSVLLQNSQMLSFYVRQGFTSSDLQKRDELRFYKLFKKIS